MTTTPTPSITTHDLTGTAVGPFATVWTYGEAGDVRATLSVGGVEGDVLAQGSDYTLTASSPLTLGGSVTLSVALVPAGGWAAETKLVLRRRTSRRQALALPDSEGHKPRATEKAFDKAMRIAEEDRDDLGRAVLAPVGETGFVLPGLPTRANRFLVFDETGTKLRADVRPEDFDAFNKANRNLENVLGSVLGAKEVRVDGAAVDLPIARMLGLTLHPEHFGGVAGDVSPEAAAANVAAFEAAAADGEVLEGFDRVYAIEAQYVPTAARWKNMRFKQSAATGAGFNRSLVFDGVADLELVNVSLDMSGLTHPNAFSVATGILIQNCPDARLHKVRAFNGTATTGVMIDNCPRIIAVDVEGHDFVAELAAMPADDIMQGVSVIDCAEGLFTRCGGRDLTANWPGRPALAWRRFSRGIAIQGCSDSVFNNCFGHRVDQGVDVTGSAGNKMLHIQSPVAIDCSTFGVKVANRNQDILVSHPLVIRAGRNGVVVSSAYAPTDPRPTRTRIVAGLVRDTGASGLYPGPADRYAYCVISLSVDEYPAGVEFIDSWASDRQAVKTTDGWFANRAQSGRTPTSTVPLNRLIGRCGGDGLAIGGVPQVGFHFPNGQTTGTGSPIIPGNGAVTVIPFNAPSYDPAGRWVGGRYYFPEPGRYRLSASVKIGPAAGGGICRLHVLKNGTEQNAHQRAWIMGHATETLPIEINRSIHALAGEYVELGAYNNSGNDRAVNLALSFFEVVKEQDLY